MKIDGVRGPNADGSWPAQGKTTVRVTKTTTYTLRARQATGTRSGHTMLPIFRV